MPAYKDTAKGTWYTSFYFEDWKGVRKKKLKRGFETKKEALKYLESNKKELNKVDINKKKSQKYRDSIRYNVSLTETEINDFWDKQQNQTQKEDTEKGESR